MHIRTDHSATDFRHSRILTRHAIALTLLGPRLQESERVDIEYELKIISGNDSVEVQLAYAGTTQVPTPRVQHLEETKSPGKGSAWTVVQPKHKNLPPVEAPISTTMMSTDIRSLVATEMAVYQRQTEARIDRIEKLTQETANDQRSLAETLFAMQSTLDKINHKLGPDEGGRADK